MAAFAARSLANSTSLPAKPKRPNRQQITLFSSVRTIAAPGELQLERRSNAMALARQPPQLQLAPPTDRPTSCSELYQLAGQQATADLDRLTADQTATVSASRLPSAFAGCGFTWAACGQQKPHPCATFVPPCRGRLASDGKAAPLLLLLLLPLLLLGGRLMGQANGPAPRLS